MDITNELRAYTKQLSKRKFLIIKETIYSMSNTGKGRLSMKSMAAYLVIAHPNLTVRLEQTSQYKDTTSQSSRLRTPGTREYVGYHLKVWKGKVTPENRRYPNLINHDTTETYRYNAEVASKIVAYEKSKR